jgi:hypothetical protein
LLKLFRAVPVQPGPILAAARTDFGDDQQILGIGMKRLSDNLVGDERTVVIADVDVVDPARHGLAQHGDRLVAVARRTEHARAGQLHGTIAHPLHLTVAKPIGTCPCDVGHSQLPGPLLKQIVSPAARGRACPARTALEAAAPPR